MGKYARTMNEEILNKSTKKNSSLRDIWHPAAQEPDDGRLCLGNYDSSLIATTFCRDTVGDWATYARLSAIKQWAYIEDLIPVE